MQQQLKNNWEKKVLHGQFPNRMNRANVSKHHSNQWLKSAGLKAETEGLIVAAQDQSLATRNYQKHVSKTISDDRCRLCKEKPETIDHLVAGCSKLASTQYLERHNRVGTYLHWKICQSAQIKTADQWYKHVPEPVVENEKMTLLWDFPISTDRTVKANRPDIIIKDKISGNCQLIDVSVPADANISSKEFEKSYKYKDLEIEIQRMWRMRTKVTPVVVGALGIITKDFEKYIEEIPGEINIIEVQKIAMLGTAHILRKALMMR